MREPPNHQRIETAGAGRGFLRCNLGPSSVGKTSKIWTRIEAMNLGAPASLPASSEPAPSRLAGRDAGAPRAGSWAARSRTAIAVMDCGGKRSATPLWVADPTRCGFSRGSPCESGVGAALCHRSPNGPLQLGGSWRTPSLSDFGSSLFSVEPFMTEAPKTKIQTPENLQTSTSKQTTDLRPTAPRIGLAAGPLAFGRPGLKVGP